MLYPSELQGHEPGLPPVGFLNRPLILIFGLIFSQSNCNNKAYQVQLGDKRAETVQIHWRQISDSRSEYVMILVEVKRRETPGQQIGKRASADNENQASRSWGSLG
ncbi:MAG: hypothetical protein CL875_06265 [Dehalococcoidales bacterium]|nr:hypothetical protein [Dehalococcoidales bacterium]